MLKGAGFPRKIFYSLYFLRFMSARRLKNKETACFGVIAQRFTIFEIASGKTHKNVEAKFASTFSS